MSNIFVSYLKFNSPRFNKQSVIGNLLLFLYFIGIPPITGDPFTLPFFLAAIIPTALMTFWGIIYVIDPYKFEKSFHLYLGVYSVINTYVYFVSIQKMMYVHLEMDGWGPF